jgi:hypothetical protein
MRSCNMEVIDTCQWFWSEDDTARSLFMTYFSRLLIPFDVARPARAAPPQPQCLGRRSPRAARPSYSSSSSPASARSRAFAPTCAHSLRGRFWTAPPRTRAHADTLGVAGAIYVSSLPHRADRHASMRALAGRLGARLTFVDAVDARGPAVRNILDHVRVLRAAS